MLQLDSDEQVVLEVRKHWIVFVSQAIFLCFAAIIPPFFLTVLSTLLPIQITTEGSFVAVAVFLYCLWILTLWISFFFYWTDYYLDVWYVTEKRIIDVEQKGIFSRNVSSIRFDKIQDINVEVRGVVATFLNYGNVEVQTASETSGSFIMKNASRPELIRQVVFSQHNKQSERPQPVHIVSQHGTEHATKL